MNYIVSYKGGPTQSVTADAFTLGEEWITFERDGDDVLVVASGIVASVRDESVKPAM